MITQLIRLIFFLNNNRASKLNVRHWQKEAKRETVPPFASVCIHRSVLNIHRKIL